MTLFAKLVWTIFFLIGLAFMWAIGIVLWDDMDGLSENKDEKKTPK